MTPWQASAEVHHQLVVNGVYELLQRHFPKPRVVIKALNVLPETKSDLGKKRRQGVHGSGVDCVGSGGPGGHGPSMSDSFVFSVAAQCQSLINTTCDYCSFTA